MEIPKIDKYMDGDTPAIRVVVGGNAFFFSYETCIAFNAGGETVVRENDWGPTTGKHLNAIDGGNKAARVSAERFAELLAAI